MNHSLCQAAVTLSFRQSPSYLVTHLLSTSSGLLCRTLVGLLFFYPLAGAFVGLFVLSMGRSFVGGTGSSVNSFVFVGGESSFFRSFFHWVVRSFVCPSFWWLVRSSYRLYGRLVD